MDAIPGSSRAEGGAAAGASPVRFVLTGAWNTGFGYGAYIGAYFLTRGVPVPEIVHYTGALVLANCLAIPQAFLAYKYVVYRTRGNVLREFPRFLVSYAVLVGINLAALPLLVHLSGYGAILAQGIFVSLAAVLAWFLHGRFSFRAAGS